MKFLPCCSWRRRLRSIAAVGWLGGGLGRILYVWSGTPRPKIRLSA